MALESNINQINRGNLSFKHGKDDDLIVSCPGKVLLIGGYLVLDRQYQGLVVGVDARFYVKIQACHRGRSDLFVVIRSPQFHDGHWEYKISTDLKLTVNPNPFIGFALLNTIKYLISEQSFWENHAGKQLDITIVVLAKIGSRQ